MEKLYKIHGHDNMLQYVCAGNSIFTIHNVKTKGRFTYKSVKSKTKEHWWQYVLTRPNNDQNESYKFIGTFSHEKGFLHSSKSYIKNDALSVISLKWMFDNISHIEDYPHFEFWHEGLCGCCGRKLTTPDSLRYGYGRRCMEHGIKNGTIIISDNQTEDYLQCIKPVIGKTIQHTKQLELF